MPKLSNSRTIWMVQYNLSGLQTPYKLTYSGDYSGWWDESGNVGVEGDEFPQDVDTRDRVARFFRTEKEADDYYAVLDRYRRFVKRHM